MNLNRLTCVLLTSVVLICIVVTISILSSYPTVFKNEKLKWYKTSNKLNQLPYCGLTNALRKKRIIGGVDTLANSYPWMVSLRVIKNNTLYDHICAGTIISSTHILTSAHCVNNLSNDTVLIAVVGIHLRDDVSQYAVQNSYTINAIKIHEDYNQAASRNDIALLTLSSRITFNTNVSALCLLEENKSFVNKSGVVAGWGINDSQSKILQQTNLKILENENLKCKNYLTNSNLIFCALNSDTNKTSNVCNGDR